MPQLVTLAAVGDIMLGDMACSFGFGVGSQIERHGPFFPFAKSAQILKRADIATGNLECVLSRFNRDIDPFEHIQLRGLPEAAQGLAQAGFGVLNLANNHIMQHGRKALEETVEALRAQRIAVVGIELPDRKVENMAVIERNGVRVAFLGYNFRPQQYFRDASCDVPGEEKRIVADIARARERCDIVVLSLHWGDEFIPYPSAEQVKLGRRLIEAGATVILGHHPHILQGIEQYRNGLIAYSLGDFVFDLWQERLRKSAILLCTFSRDGLQKFEVVPVAINAQWQPEPLEDEEAEDEMAEFEILNRQIRDDRPESVYQAEVALEDNRFRKEVHSHYVRNIFRYNLLRLLGNALGAVRRRL